NDLSSYCYLALWNCGPPEKRILKKGISKIEAVALHGIFSMRIYAASLFWLQQGSTGNVKPLGGSQSVIPMYPTTRHIL
ncbi:MAG: hypothetical protein VXW29_05685, partial [SAR324 cluster bacterium]|nr:hypothetical protein [SAR324 cluster bacterium]